MRFKQIIENTTAGSVATVAKPLMTQAREDTTVSGLKPVQQVMKGVKKKGPYANSIVESKVNEDDLAEQDLIVIPGQGRLKRTGFVKHDLDQGEHEGETLKNSLHTIARAAMDLDKRLSMQSEFPEWVSEKIGAAKGMMVSVMDYLVSSQEMQHDPDAMEGVAEGVSLKQKHEDKKRADQNQVRYGKMTQAEFDKKWTRTERPKPTDKKQGVAEGEKMPAWKKAQLARDAERLKHTSHIPGHPQPISFNNRLAVGHKDNPNPYPSLNDYNANGDDEYQAKKLKAKKKQGVAEGAKVDRMVKHVKQSEKKLGHSAKEAENIAWATANKRGMLDNKNKKK